MRGARAKRGDSAAAGSSRQRMRRFVKGRILAPCPSRAHPCALSIKGASLCPHHQGRISVPFPSPTAGSSGAARRARSSLSPPAPPEVVGPSGRRPAITGVSVQPRQGALPALFALSLHGRPAAAGRRAPRPGSARPPAQPSPECSAADAGGASLLSGGARGEGGGGRGGPTTAGRCNTRLGAGPAPGAPLVLCDSLPILFGSPHALAQSPKPDRRTSPTGAG